MEYSTETTDGQIFKPARDSHPATNLESILCGPKPATNTNITKLRKRTPNYATLRFLRSLHPFPTRVLRSFTSTPRRSGNIPSHTSHMVFPHGPRPVSHVTPPGTRHSRPERSRGRPLRTLPGHHTPLSAVHPPRCSCLTKSGCPGTPSACGHVTLALAPHDFTALALHDFTALAPHDFTTLAPQDPTALAPSPRARSLDP
jgi:hypothetical protein